MSHAWLTKVWIAVRFLCFGIVGLFVFFAGFMFMALPEVMSRYLAGLLALGGLLMVLFGVGQWGR